MSESDVNKESLDEFHEAYNYFLNEFTTEEEIKENGVIPTFCSRWANQARKEASLAVYTSSDYNWDYVSNAQSAHPQAREDMHTYYVWIFPDCPLIQNYENNKFDLVEKGDFIAFFKGKLPRFRTTEFGFLGYKGKDFIHCNRGVVCTNVISFNVYGNRALRIFKQYMKQGVSKHFKDHAIMAIGHLPHKSSSWSFCYDNKSFVVTQTSGVETLHRFTINEDLEGSECEYCSDADEFCSNSNFDDPSTYFELKSSGNLLARCLMTWSHVEYAEYGPTIEMISTIPEYRGHKYGLLLNREVENFVRHIGYPPSDEGLIRMFCYKIEGGVFVEKYKGKDVTDQKFMFKYLGYTTSHEFKGMWGLIGGNRGEDGFKDIPVHVKEQKNYKIKRQKGLMTCENCLERETKRGEFSLCAGCERVRYCSKACQKENWKRHKVLCKLVRKKRKQRKQEESKV